MTEVEDTEPQADSTPSRAHRKLGLALIVVASLLTFLAIFAVWANRQLLNTDNWTDTSTELLENDAIRTQIGAFLVESLYANVDVKGELEQVFEQVLQPAGASTLAGPAASGLRSLADQRVEVLLQRPRVQQLWEAANRRAHLRLLEIINGGGDTLSTSDGDVTLNLSSLLSQTQSNLGVGGRLEEKLPESAAQIVLFHSDQLDAAQKGVKLLKSLAIALVALALILFGLGVYLARGWRREALRACGVGFIFAAAAALVARSVGGGAVVDALATTEAVRPAVEASWSIGTSLLVEVATAALIYGVVVVFAAWLAGPTAWAVGTRRALAPYMREPRYAWGAFGVIVLVLIAWAPTPAFRLVIPCLILIGLLAAGTEALRRQTMREFPEADHRQSSERLGQWVAGLGRRRRRRILAGLRPAPRSARTPRSNARQRCARRFRVQGREGQDPFRGAAARLMCRWNAYVGQPLLMGELLYRTEHGLIDESLHSRMGAETTNGDGFGVGWYGVDGSTGPARYRSVNPAWNDSNMRELADHIETPLFLAHIRAAIGSPVQQTNCHPFRNGRWLFVHNGMIAGIPVLRRDLLMAVDPSLFNDITGSTDSELVFHLALTFGLEDDPARGNGAGDRLRRVHGERARGRKPRPGHLRDQRRRAALGDPVLVRPRLAHALRFRRRGRGSAPPPRERAVSANERGRSRRGLGAAFRPAGRLA